MIAEPDTSGAPSVAPRCRPTPWARFVVVLSVASPGCVTHVVAPPDGPVAVIPIARGQNEAAAAAVAVEPTPKDVDGMVLVPAGSFPHGCSPKDANCFENEKPAREVYLHAFHIDRTEVTVAAYRQCVLAGRCTEEGLGFHFDMNTTANAPTVGHNRSRVSASVPSNECNWNRPGRDKHPVNCVDWNQAVAYCSWAGKRLPTEAEWEKAARGTSPRIYSWGNQTITCHRTVIGTDSGGSCGNHGTAAVGSKPDDRSPYGLLDMTGNVNEWVEDWYGEDYYVYAPDRNPPGPAAGSFRIIRGGSWRGGIWGTINPLRASNRYSYSPQLRFNFTGFRCARSVPAQVAG